MRGLLILATCLSLVACATGSTLAWYKQGDTVARLQSTLQQCQAEGQRQYPVKPATGPVTPVDAAKIRNCDPNVGGFVSCDYGTGADSDVNASARVSYVNQCVARHGWQTVSLPQCSGSVSKAANAGGDQTRMPPLGPGSCAYFTGKGAVAYTP